MEARLDNSTVRYPLRRSQGSQIWSLRNGILSNNIGVTLTGKWILPPLGAIGTIQNDDTGVNGYLSVNANTTDGSAVVEEAEDSKDNGQQWKVIAGKMEHTFWLKNTYSRKFLTTKCRGDFRPK